MGGHSLKGLLSYFLELDSNSKIECNGQQTVREDPNFVAE
jgi:hypothetical protein